MKTQSFLKLLLLLAMAGEVACSDDHDDKGPGTMIDQAFAAKYPEAVGTEWESRGPYARADFDYNNQDTKAWFYQDGSWLLTTTEIPYIGLPQPVLQGLSNSLYASWVPDAEAEVFEQALVEKYYIVEVSRPGSADRDLYFSPEGDLHREVTEDYDGDRLPAMMAAFLKQKYPAALFIQGEKLLDNRFDVYFFDRARMCTAWFTPTQEWEYTEWPVEQKHVPAVVLEVLTGEAYKDFRIRTIRYRQTPATDMYYFDLYKAGSMDIIVRITPEGKLILN